jgi:hypothetical protein
MENKDLSPSSSATEELPKPVTSGGLEGKLEKENDNDIFPKELFLSLLDAIKNGNKDKVDQLKKEFYSKFPDQLELIEVVFGFIDFTFNQVQINFKKAFEKELENLKFGQSDIRGPDIFRQLTEYQFLVTHYVLSNNQDAKFMEKFWKLLRAIYVEIANAINKELCNLSLERKSLTRSVFRWFKSGILAQVAAFEILKELGMSPQISHPDQDAFYSFDLIARTEREEDNKQIVVQVKSEKGITYPIIFKFKIDGTIKELSFPSSSDPLSSEKKKFFPLIKVLKEIKYLLRGIRIYKESVGEEVTGYLIFIPYSGIDHNTGKPSQEIVDYCREKIVGEK